MLSPDFYVGIPVGVCAAVSSGFSSTVRATLPGVLVAVAGIGAAVATLVLTALTVQLASISPAYRRYLAKVPGGVAGTARPFQWVMGVAAATTAWSLVGAGLAPLVMNDGLAAFAISAGAYALLLWAVFGCVQLTNQLIKHWHNRDRAEDLEVRRQQMGEKLN